MTPTGSVTEKSRSKLNEIRKNVNGGRSADLLKQVQQLPPEQQISAAQKVWHGIIAEHLESGEPMPEDLRAECDVFFEAVFSGYATSNATSTVGSSSR